MLGVARHWHPVLRTYMIPFITSRRLTVRLLPRHLAGGINGATSDHSSRSSRLRRRSCDRPHNKLGGARPHFPEAGGGRAFKAGEAVMEIARTFGVDRATIYSPE